MQQSPSPNSLEAVPQAPQTQPLARGAHKIGWRDLDLFNFAVFSSTLFIIVRSFVYPFVLVKTRLQFQQAKSYNGAFDAIKKILASEGYRGLYRGFLTVSVGIIPTQFAYVGGYEMGKQAAESYLGPDNDLAGFIGGACASFSSSSLGVPLDVISQRLMVQHMKNEVVETQYKNGWNAISTIIANDGVRGLYRGFGASLCTYAPTSAVWWGTYNMVRKITYGWSNDSKVVENLTAMLSGGISGVVAATATNPLDVAKTRLQIQRKQAAQQSGQPALVSNLFTSFQALVKNEGLISMWRRGLTARCTSMGITGSISILAYENVKKFSLKDTTP